MVAASTIWMSIGEERVERHCVDSFSRQRHLYYARQQMAPASEPPSKTGGGLLAHNELPPFTGGGCHLAATTGAGGWASLRSPRQRADPGIASNSWTLNRTA